jgi:hypothetical protein
MAANELEKLSTPRLNAYRRRLLRVQESVGLSDLSPSELAELDPSFVYFKRDSLWQDTIHAVMAILNRRAA